MQSSAHVIVAAMAEGKKLRTEMKASKAAVRSPRLTTVELLVGIVISIGVAIAVGYLLDSQLAIRILRVIAIILAVVFFGAFLYRLIRLGYRYEWTGFGEANLPKPENREVRPKKTVWDWMQLLIVPVVLALVTVAFTLYQEGRQTRIEQQRAQNALKAEEQRAQDAALQAYLDQMSTLMLEEDLRNSEEASGVRTLARARTATVIQRLDANGNQNVIRFLDEAGLAKGGQSSPGLLAGVDLRGAHLEGVALLGTDLSGADLRELGGRGSEAISGLQVGGPSYYTGGGGLTDLSGADLSSADLSGVDLRWAWMDLANLELADLSNANLRNAYLGDTNLSGADLSGADLSTATLSGAGLINANLRNADLSNAHKITNEELERQAASLEGATMRNGQKYEDWIKDKEGGGKDVENE